MRRFALGIAVVALVICTSPAEAQLRTYSLGVSGGLSLPLSQMAKSVTPGFNIAGHFSIMPASFTNLSFRADLSYDRWSVKDEALAPSSTSGSARILGIAVNAVYELPVGSMVTPYVLGGIGSYGRKFVYQFPNATVDSEESGFGFQGGAGLAFTLSGFSTFVEGRFTHVPTDPNSTQYVPLVFGIRF